ncbi:DUF7288 family protein [Halorarius halobius]|uniref:DUF7288 family protein n=1 Tax=Halorarius halobius TaxID=2962671 RepID=UPI0020CE381C|nr:hypothetical protein [Halorarius halobius]
MRGPTSRGQAFTLEAIVAALVVLGSLLFALQASGVTALTASTSNPDAVAQREATATGVLDAAVADGTLRPTLLYWDGTRSQFHGTDFGEDHYTVGPPTAFGALLNETLDDRSLAVNVDLEYLNASGGLERRPLVRYGRPSDDAATATRTVTLYDDDRLLAANGTATTTLSNASFYAPDRYPGGPVYTVVRVEVVVWRV